MFADQLYFFLKENLQVKMNNGSIFTKKNTVLASSLVSSSIFMEIYYLRSYSFINGTKELYVNGVTGSFLLLLSLTTYDLVRFRNRTSKFRLGIANKTAWLGLANKNTWLSSGK